MLNQDEIEEKRLHDMRQGKKINLYFWGCYLFNRNKIKIYIFNYDWRWWVGVPPLIHSFDSNYNCITIKYSIQSNI